MKRNILFTLCIVVIIGGLYFFLSQQFVNQNINIAIDNINLEPLSNSELDYVREQRAYDSHNLSTSEVNDILLNPYQYKKLLISYHVENDSNSEMEDLRFEPLFVDELKSHVITYQTGNGTYYVSILPNSTGGLTQNILLKVEEKNEQEILDLLKESQLQMSYFTGELHWSNGHGHVGFGKKKINLGEFRNFMS